MLFSPYTCTRTFLYDSCPRTRTCRDAVYVYCTRENLSRHPLVVRRSYAFHISSNHHIFILIGCLNLCTFFKKFKENWWIEAISYKTFTRYKDFKSDTKPWFEWKCAQSRKKVERKIYQTRKGSESVKFGLDESNGWQKKINLTDQFRSTVGSLTRNFASRNSWVWLWKGKLSRWCDMWESDHSVRYDDSGKMATGNHKIFIHSQT